MVWASERFISQAREKAIPAMVRFIKSLFIDGNRLIDPLDKRGPRRPDSFPGKSASLENGGLGTQLPNLVRTARHAAAPMRHKWNHRLAGKVEEKFKDATGGAMVLHQLGLPMKITSYLPISSTLAASSGRTPS